MPELRLKKDKAIMRRYKLKSGSTVKRHRKLAGGSYGSRFK